MNPSPEHATHHNDAASSTGHHANAAPAPVAESAAAPVVPALKRGDDTLQQGEAILLISALGTLIAVITGLFLF